MSDIKSITLDGTSYTLKDETARTSAANAVSTANTAKQTATTANNTANTANQTASTAITTANTNKTAIAAINDKTFAKASYSNEVLTLTNAKIGG